jgi:signal peptidase I
MQTLGLADSTPKTEGRLRALFWPRIANEVDAATAAQNAMYGCLALSILNAALALFRVLDSSAWLYSVLLALLALGIRQFSITAAIMALTLYVVNLIASALQGALGVGIVIAIILTGLFLASVRAAFFMRQFATADSERAAPVERGVLARMLPWIRPVAFGLAGLVLMAGTISFVFFRAFVMPTGSMEPTILVGDRFFVLRSNFMGRIRRGDLLAFHFPPDPRQLLVKRVLGLPGDRLHLESKTLILNGAAVAEPYAHHMASYPDAYRDNFPAGQSGTFYEGGQRMFRENLRDGEIVVPRGSYFVLGDNRDNSLDSRYWGFLSKGDVIGRPLYIYGSQRPNRAGIWFIRYPIPEEKALRTFLRPRTRRARVQSWKISRSSPHGKTER